MMQPLTKSYTKCTQDEAILKLGVESFCYFRPNFPLKESTVRMRLRTELAFVIGLSMMTVIVNKKSLRVSQ